MQLAGCQASQLHASVPSPWTAQFHLNKLVEKQVEAFARGFNRLASSQVMRLFDHEELELVVCGSPVFDFDEL